MKSKSGFSSTNHAWRGTIANSNTLILGAAIALFGTLAVRAADDAGAQKLLAEAKAKELHAQQMRAQAAQSLEKSSDDQMEAEADERESRILSAQALKLLGADANKQQAFRLRTEARKLWAQSNDHLVWARNAEQKAAQLTHNAEELRKTTAELKDQPAIAATLEAEAKEQVTQAQTESQTANSDKYSAQQLAERAKGAWAQAEKLDPETHRQVAPVPPKPPVAEAHQVR